MKFDRVDREGVELEMVVVALALLADEGDDSQRPDRR